MLCFTVGAGAAIGAAATRLVDHSCFTSLDPATATVMACSNKGITGPIPPELGKYTALVDLRLTGNHLTGAVPPEFGELANLGTLYASSNRLTALPSMFSKLQNLEKIYLWNNTFSGTVPAVGVKLVIDNKTGAE